MLTLLTVTAALVASAAAACPKYPYAWTSHGGNCYLLSNFHAPWEDAMKACSDFDLRANLTTIRSQIENDFLFETFTPTYTWIGLNDRETEGEFEWAGGSRSTFRNWIPNLPKDEGHGRNCVRIDVEKNKGQWRDWNCATPMRFLCEIVNSA